jgi:hypothetical protein
MPTAPDDLLMKSLDAMAAEEPHRALVIRLLQDHEAAQDQRIAELTERVAALEARAG